MILCGFLGVHYSINFGVTKIGGTTQKKGTVPFHEKDSQPLHQVVENFGVLSTSVSGQLTSQPCQGLQCPRMPTPQGFHWQGKEYNSLLLASSLATLIFWSKATLRACPASLAE